MTQRIVTIVIRGPMWKEVERSCFIVDFFKPLIALDRMLLSYKFYPAWWTLLIYKEWVKMHKSVGGSHHTHMGKPQVKSITDVCLQFRQKCFHCYFWWIWLTFTPTDFISCKAWSSCQVWGFCGQQRNCVYGGELLCLLSKTQVKPATAAQLQAMVLSRFA